MSDLQYTIEHIANGWLVTIEKAVTMLGEDDRPRYFEDKQAAIKYVISELNKEAQAWDMVQQQQTKIKGV